jgi:uncharacterized protein (TIGR00725 family)
MKKRIIGVMGPGESASDQEQKQAFLLGQAIAKSGWILLTGGRSAGVMASASQGAKQVGGLTIGILPGSSMQGVSAAVDIPILTGMGQGRNIINVLSSHVVIACGLGAGTASELCLAIKIGKPVILLSMGLDIELKYRFFQDLLARLDPSDISDMSDLHEPKVTQDPKRIAIARDVTEAIQLCSDYFQTIH